MPPAPLPLELQRFVEKPHPAIVATLDRAGAPRSAATWYDWEEGRILISMVAGGPRERNLWNDPRVALTILGDNWYDHVSIEGRASTIRDDPDLKDFDRLALRYIGKPKPNRSIRVTSVLIDVVRWHAWGNPGVEPALAANTPSD